MSKSPEIGHVSGMAPHQGWGNVLEIFFARQKNHIYKSAPFLGMG